MFPWHSAHAGFPTKLAPGITGGTISVPGVVEHEFTTKTSPSPTPMLPLIDIRGSMRISFFFRFHRRGFEHLRNQRFRKIATHRKCHLQTSRRVNYQRPKIMIDHAPLTLEPNLLQSGEFFNLVRWPCQKTPVVRIVILKRRVCYGGPAKEPVG